MYSTVKVELMNIQERGDKKDLMSGAEVAMSLARELATSWNQGCLINGALVPT